MAANRSILWSSLSVAAVLLVSACDQPPENDAAGNSAVDTTPEQRLPLTEPPMDRAALLAEVAKAASIAALGGRSDRGQGALDGKPFELRIRFGCTVQATRAPSSDGPFNVRFNEKDRTLRVRAAPDLTLDDPKIAARAAESIESVEGFWMYRPWLLAAGCPATPGTLPPLDAMKAGEGDDVAVQRPASDPDRPPVAALSNWRVGIAQFFTDADSRTRRRDQRAYEATKLLPAGETPSAQGYDLVLEGRLRKFPDGSVISCTIENIDAPPQCVVSAGFDRVTIEQPATGEVLAQWGP